MNVKGKKSDLQLDSTWILIKLYCILKVRLPWWLSSKKKKICLQCRRWGFDPWVKEDPLEKELETHAIILDHEIQSHEQRSLVGYSL